MGESQHIKKLLARFRDNSIDKSEFGELFSYLKDPSAETEIKQLMSEHWDELHAHPFNTDRKPNNELFDALLEKIEDRTTVRKLNTRKSLTKWLSVAAMIAVIFSAGYFYTTESISLEPTLDLPNEAVTLELDNGAIKVISEQDTEQILNASGLVLGTQTGTTIAYKNNISEEKLAFNTLTVPYGKRFQVVLSDGTKVHLNAGTSLKYPVKFINGLSRQVFLDGEAYFDVAKDSKHPFLINADEMNIRVLGTQFNVSSYPEDETISTVLVEGSVGIFEKGDVYNSNTATMLAPGFKAAWNKQNQEIAMAKTDVEQHTAWMDGRLILDEVPFEAILKKLERQYNVTFLNNNKELEDRFFTARFDIEDIYQVMKSLSVSASFSYTLDNNQIIINP